MSGQERITQEAVDGVAVLTITGEIDLASGTSLGEAVREQPGPVVLDVRGCTFMDSSGLRELLVARQTTASRGARLVLVGDAQNPVMHLLDVTGTSRIFNVRRDLTLAIEVARQQDQRLMPDRRQAPSD